MDSIQDFLPDWVSAPGDTIADILRERDLSEIDFARLIGKTPQDAKDLLQGRATITLATARQLERCLGASVEFWMSRDFQYRQDIAKVHATYREWLNELPVGDMIRFGWLTPVPHPAEEVDACLHFFNVPTVTAWHKTYGSLQQMAAFRTSPSFDSRPAAVAAWLRQGEIQAEAINCGPWNARQFQEALLNIRPLTREKDPSRFLPKLEKLCADSGVAVVIVRAPSGCRASGATRFLSQDRALLQLSFRYLTDDHLWFTFFHEAGHLLLHGKRGFFLEGTDTPSTTQEEEANEFSARTLVPPEFQSALLGLSADRRKVIRFAKDVGVSPGIIVGQMQHLGRIRRNQLNGLKRRFEWED
jgi:HTH-type transcriptional regulator / antitoxin HigA